jgi:hypothetical protein
MDSMGIEPTTARMRSERSTPELTAPIPLAGNFTATMRKNYKSYKES